MLSNSKRTQINKAARKAVFDTEKLHQIIDESLIAHIAIEEESGPVVFPCWHGESRIMFISTARATVG